MKGIYFRPYNIEAIIEGRKTQTRRVIKQLDPEFEWEVIDTGEPIRMFKDGIGGCIFLQPRYQVGVVYIKEAWWTYSGSNAVHFALAEPPPKLSRHFGKLHSPMFLKAKDARYFILIKDVRAERLREITEEDANKEGFYIILGNMDRPPARWYFKNAWDSINKDYPWESNPWVFRYEFELKEMPNG